MQNNYSRRIRPLLCFRFRNTWLATFETFCLWLKSGVSVALVDSRFKLEVLSFGGCCLRTAHKTDDKFCWSGVEHIEKTLPQRRTTSPSLSWLFICCCQSSLICHLSPFSPIFLDVNNAKFNLNHFMRIALHTKAFQVNSWFPNSN